VSGSPNSPEPAGEQGGSDSSPPPGREARPNPVAAREARRYSSATPVRGLPPHAQAAFDLSRWALFFLPYFVGGLLAIFVLTEWWQQWTISSLQNAAIAASRNSGNQPDTAPFDRLLAALDLAAASQPIDSKGLRNAIGHVGDLLPFDAGQRQMLQLCATEVETPPQAGSRQDVLTACRAMVQTLRSKAVETYANSALTQLVALVRLQEDARTAFRSSWLLVAQLVLLNLMLPLLTGLFGYLFGRQSVGGGGAEPDHGAADVSGGES
jgi:hypothetical protein